MSEVPTEPATATPGARPSPLAGALTGLALILPVFPLYVFLAEVPTWEERFIDAEAAVPGIVRAMLAGWIAPALIALFVLGAIVLFIAATDRNRTGNRVTLPLGATLGWAVIAAVTWIGRGAAERAMGG